jgi:hypothetical protein
MSTLPFKGGETGSQHTHEEGQIFINTAQCKGNTVAWKKVRKEKVKMDRKLLVEMKIVSQLLDENVRAKNESITF